MDKSEAHSNINDNVASLSLLKVADDCLHDYLPIKGLRI